MVTHSYALSALCIAAVLSLTPVVLSGQRLGLEIRNGWFVHRGRVVWGWVQHNGWWRPGQRPNITRRSVGDPLGDVRPNRTEDLDKLTDNMLRWGYPGFEHNFGLWYDRRRDAHDTARRTDPNVKPPFLEQPWARSDHGTAWDGLPKYDLTKFNPWYFQRLEEFARLCEQKGCVFFHKYYMQHALLETQAHYVDFPWRPCNCIQHTDMPDQIPAANAFYDVSHPVRRKLHQLYIRRCLDSLGQYSSVVHCISEEYTGPLPFAQFWLDTVVQWAKEHGRHLHIAIGAPKDVLDAILADPNRSRWVDVIDLRYFYIRADGSLYAPRGGDQVPGRYLESGFGASRESTPERMYQKVRSYRDRYPDKAIIDAIGQDRKQSWACLMAGAAMLVAGQIEYPGHKDPPEYIKPAGVDEVLPTYYFIRQHLATVLPNMRPADIIKPHPDRNWCLADGRGNYLIYALRGGSFRVDLTGQKHRLIASWFDPRTGKLTPAKTRPVPGGRWVRFNCPTDEDWALWLRPE